MLLLAGCDHQCWVRASFRIVERVERGPRPAWVVVVAASWLALGVSAEWFHREHAFTTASWLMLAGVAVYVGLVTYLRCPAPLPLLAVLLFCSGIAFDAFFVTWWPVTVSLAGSIRRAVKRGEHEAWSTSCATAGGWLAAIAAGVAWVFQPCCGGPRPWLLIGLPMVGALVSFALAAPRRSQYRDPDRVPRLVLDATLGFARLALPLILMFLVGWMVTAGEGKRYQDRWDNTGH